MTLNTDNINTDENPNAEVLTVEEKVPSKAYAPDFGKLAIKPYFTGAENMGLENYECVLFPGTTQTETVACLEDGNISRYLTGLDEFSPSVRLMKDEDAKAARIKSIREKVAYLEEALKSNVIKVDDEEFWNKVQALQPDNSEFWETITVTLSNDDLPLFPKEKPKDLIIIECIQAGGFSLIAKSWEDARAMAQAPKFYLDQEGISSKNRTETMKIRNKALRILDELSEDNKNKLMLVCKMTDTRGHQYDYSTPVDVMYENMDKWIAGKAGDKDPIRAAKTFTTNANLDAKTLKINAMCKDATFFKIIALKGDGQLYHMDSNTVVGRNLNEAYEFFANPVNDDLLEQLMKKVTEYWEK